MEMGMAMGTEVGNGREWQGKVMVMVIVDEVVDSDEEMPQEGRVKRLIGKLFSNFIRFHQTL